ncbi:MAG TPA: LysR family transcriptional regulator [Casimicrobiaceae bacterium]|nr:LysR family transcriptional regulator [Casimicrobiaceae bacterium]
MELRQMQQFVAVAEARSFRRAAERLHMAQPPLSQAIRRLERELEVRLFNRTSRNVELTDAGKALLAEARDVLARADAAIVAARQAAQGRTGRLRIGFTAPWAYDIVVRAVAAFRRQHDAVTLTLREGTSSEQVSLLLDGSLDVGFLRLPHDHDIKGLQTRTLRADVLSIVLPPSHSLVRARSLPLRRLHNEAFVLPPLPQEHGLEDLSLRVQITRLCAESGFLPRVAQEASRMETIVRLVAAGFGVAIVPAWTRTQWSTAATYVRLQSDSPLARLTLAAAWSPASTSSARERFVETLRGIAKR